jgi:translation initiation factor 4A
MSARPSSSSSQPIFQTTGSSPFGIRQEDFNPPFPNGKHPLANTFTVSPRSSPAPSDQRGSEAATSTHSGVGNIGSIGSIGDPVGKSGPRFNPPVFRSSFTDDYQGPIHRALDPIPPDQREPFITVDSPPSSNTSPSFRVNEGERPYPPLETHANSRDRSVSGHIETTDEVPHLPALGGQPIFRQGSFGPGISPFTLQRQNSLSNNLTPRQSVSQDNFVSSNLSGPSLPLNANSGNSSIPDATLASSPVSTGSAPSANSFIIGANDRSIDAQIKNSPFLHDILDRVIRTEYAQRDLSREIGALSNKINLLVERLELGDSRRSFSASPRPGGMMGGNFPGSPPGGPLHHNPTGDGDISKRLDALTSSVQQILMIQQQNHVNSTNAPFRDNGSISPSVGPGGGFDQIPPMMNIGGGPGMMGPPNRPQVRNPAPPMRTWSAGSLDLPMRQDNPHLARPDALINQKRRSVVGNLTRRDSSAVRSHQCYIIFSNTSLQTVDSDWGNSSPRDSGPTITKWEHLQLVPDLLRSISKYG